MWLLTPLLPSASQISAEDAPNPVQYLTGSRISLGRPAKKGGTTGKADVLIFNEGSVSSIHAQIAIDRQSGRITITDSSKYGTHIRRVGHDASAAEQKLPTGEEVELAEGDVLRFGSKCRFKLTCVPLHICDSSSSGDSSTSNSELAAAAAACGASLTPTCAAEDCAFCIAAEGAQLTPQVLLALLERVPLATPGWLQGLATKAAWAKALLDPQAAVGTAAVPRQLLLQVPGQQQPAAVDVGSWQAAAADLLAKYVLVVGAGVQSDLSTAASLLGALTLSASSSGLDSAQLAAGQTRATETGRAALMVAAAAASKGDAAGGVVSDQQLLHAMVTGDLTALKAAAAAFQAAAAAAVAAAPAAAAAAPAGSEEEATEEEEDGAAADDAAEQEELEAVLPAMLSRRSQPQQQQPSAPQEAAVPPAAAAAAAAAAPSPAVAAAAGAAGGRKRTMRGEAVTAAAAAAADTQDAEEKTPTKKRQKVAESPPAAAGTSGKKRGRAKASSAAADDWVMPAAAAASDLQQQQPQADSRLAPAPAAAAPANGAAEPQTTQMTQIKDGVYSASLLVRPEAPATAALPAPAAASGPGAVVNFKAFRRKHQQQQPGGTAGLPQQQGWEPAWAQAPSLVIPATVVFDKAYAGPDAEAFLKDERHRLERLKKADELFNANIKARKK